MEHLAKVKVERQVSAIFYAHFSANKWLKLIEHRLEKKPRVIRQARPGRRPLPLDGGKSPFGGELPELRRDMSGFPSNSHGFMWVAQMDVIFSMDNATEIDDFGVPPFQETSRTQ